jgi:hypothetical protein
MFDLLNFQWTKYFLKNRVVVLISLLAGIASHLFWDAFTHRNGFFVEHFSLLAKEVSCGGFTISVYHILQHGSSLLGAAIIYAGIKRLPENKNAVLNPKFLYWIISFVIMLVVIGAGYLFGQDYFLYGQLIITGISGGLTGLIISSLFWKSFSRKKINNENHYS